MSRRRFPSGGSSALVEKPGSPHRVLVNGARPVEVRGSLEELADLFKISELEAVGVRLKRPVVEVVLVAALLPVVLANDDEASREPARYRVQTVQPRDDLSRVLHFEGETGN